MGAQAANDWRCIAGAGQWLASTQRGSAAAGDPASCLATFLPGTGLDVVLTRDASACPMGMFSHDWTPLVRPSPEDARPELDGNAFLLHRAPENYDKAVAMVFAACRPKDHNLENLDSKVRQARERPGDVRQ
jgi:hypothetical protein